MNQNQSAENIRTSLIFEIVTCFVTHRRQVMLSKHLYTSLT